MTKTLVLSKLKEVTIGARQNACHGVKLKTTSLAVNTFGTKAIEDVISTLMKSAMDTHGLIIIIVGFVVFAEREKRDFV